MFVKFEPVLGGNQGGKDFADFSLGESAGVEVVICMGDRTVALEHPLTPVVGFPFGFRCHGLFLRRLRSRVEPGSLGAREF